MELRWRRIVVGGLFVVLLPLALIAVLVMAGPTERDAAAAFARTLSGWPDLLFGIVAALAVGWAVARPVANRHALHGALVGAMAGAIDILVLVLADAPFDWVHPLAIMSGIAAGAAGGALAGRQRRKAPALRGA